MEWYQCFTVAERYDRDQSFTLERFTVTLTAHIIGRFCSSCEIVCHFCFALHDIKWYQSAMIHIFKYDMIGFELHDAIQDILRHLCQR